MAAKESDRSKTSKTSRVMNLISRKQDSAPASGEEATAAPAPASSGPVPPILSSLAPDAAVSVQIRDALEDALEEELNGQPAPQNAAPAVEPEPAPAPEAATPAPETPPVQEPVPPQATAPAPEAPPEPAAQAETVSPAEVPLTSDAPDFTPHLDKPHGYINVMQVLVEEKAERYAKMFGVCTCTQCMNDIKALALNHLPSKYVVMDEGERIPKLTFYEGQYSSDITAQLLKACEQVNRRPHHAR